MNEKLEMITDKVNTFAEDHPVAYLAICFVGGFALVMPACVLSYKMMGKTAGKAAARELAEAGVSLGYSHK